MKKIFSNTALIAAATMLVAGCASNAPKEAKNSENHSGFLPGYSDMQEAKDPAGETVLKYVNPKLSPANYSAVIVEPVISYPKSQPTEQLSQETLDQIRTYITNSLRAAINDKSRVTNTPGPGVARLQVAITGATKEGSGLKPYQLVPLALVATMAYRGVQGTPQQSKLFVEALGTDSVSGEVLLKSVRSHTGKELQRTASGQSVITFDSVKPIIDQWAKASGQLVAQYLKPR